MILEIAKKGIFLLRNWSTNISLHAFIIIDDDGYSLDLFFNLITGKIFALGFVKVKFSIFFFCFFLLLRNFLLSKF